MAKEIKKAKKEKKAEAVSTTKVKADFSGMSVKEAKTELQKLALKIRTGEEKNTSKVKALKKYIARELTKANLKI